MPDPTTDRSITFEAIDNFRDLGGLRTRDGRVVRRGRVFRSGELRDMTESDYARLTGDLGVRTIIDLRRPDELESVGVSPLIKPPVRRLSVRLVQAQDPESAVQQTLAAGSLGKVYELSLTDFGFGRKLTSALESIADRESHPLVFHCSLGKDRAGVLAASLLAVLGVTDEHIANDYAMSAGPARRRLEREMQHREAAEPVRSWPSWVVEAAPESILHALAFVRRQFGSMDGYLRAHGGDATLPDRLRRALLR